MEFIKLESQNTIVVKSANETIGFIKFYKSENCWLFNATRKLTFSAIELLEISDYMNELM